MNSSTVLVSWYGKNVNCKNMNSSTVLVSWYLVRTLVCYFGFLKKATKHYCDPYQV